jgi:NADH dehydrogenase
MRNIVIVGGGFAGVWAALGAPREAASRTRSGQQLNITLVSPEPWLTIRPRLYEGSTPTNSSRNPRLSSER